MSKKCLSKTVSSSFFVSLSFLCFDSSLQMETPNL